MAGIVAPEQEVFPRQLAALKAAVQRGLQLFETKRLDDEITGPGPQRAHSGFEIGVGRHEDDIADRRGRKRFIPIQAIAPRQANVEQDEVEVQARAQGFGLLDTLGALDQREARGQCLLQIAAHAGLVIDDQYRGGGEGVAAATPGLTGCGGGVGSHGVPRVNRAVVVAGEIISIMRALWRAAHW